MGFGWTKSYTFGNKKILQLLKVRCSAVNNHTSSSLPLDRIREAAVFEIVEIDLAGAIFLKGGQKIWICIFTCAVHMAMHFELTNTRNLTAFLMIMGKILLVSITCYKGLIMKKMR